MFHRPGRLTFLHSEISRAGLERFQLSQRAIILMATAPRESSNSPRHGRFSREIPVFIIRHAICFFLSPV